MAKKPVQLDANGHRKFGIRDSVAYAAGDLGCNMSFALKGTMAIFWTQVMGMSAWYSILLIIVQVWDALNDPIIGTMIDADNGFSDSTRYGVALKLVTGGTLLPSILSGKGPHVYMGLGASDVINYAIREAVVGING